ncbi:N-acetyltransferase family protein [Streptosporangium longisporum]|uniref:N-acetyltransferase domain-containing protein n=1 Tax=Streptosporangium longisporum TaxID=46187 RepID=A0ABP6KMD0_9ACTN
MNTDVEPGPAPRQDPGQGPGPDFGQGPGPDPEPGRPADGRGAAGRDAGAPVGPVLSPGLEIRPMRDDDAGPVLAIYQAGLDGGQASFETTVPTWERFVSGRLAHPRYVAVLTGTPAGTGTGTRTGIGARAGSGAGPVPGEVVGWVAASPVSARPVYAGVVEHSLYVRPGLRGRGVGRALLAAFVTASEEAGIWTIQSGIFPENTASLSLHLSLGFRVVGVRERVGRHHGVWRDVIMLERRSTVAGT